MLAFCVVTPTLNAGHLLEATARSVVRCLGPKDRYIIVDGGSTDGSVDAVRMWAPPNVHFARDHGGGMYDAIATGFEGCQEPLMAWLNASDLYLDGALDWVRAEFERTGADILHFDDLHVDASGRVVRRSRGTVPHLARALRVGWSPLQDGCMWRASLYGECGGISANWKLAGDFDFFYRAMTIGKLAYGNGVVSAFRQHDGQLSRSAAYSREKKVILNTYRSNGAMSTGRLGIFDVMARATLSIRYRSGMMQLRTPYVGMDANSLRASF